MKYQIVEVSENTYRRAGMYRIIEVNNPHVTQHTGYFSTFEKAEISLSRLCWGERIEGDI